MEDTRNAVPKLARQVALITRQWKNGDHVPDIHVDKVMDYVHGHTAASNKAKHIAQNWFVDKDQVGYEGINHIMDHAYTLSQREAMATHNVFPYDPAPEEINERLRRVNAERRARQAKITGKPSRKLGQSWSRRTPPESEITDAHRAFEAAIAREPNNPAHHFAFADWLERNQAYHMRRHWILPSDMNHEIEYHRQEGQRLQERQNTLWTPEEDRRAREHRYTLVRPTNMARRHYEAIANVIRRNGGPNRDRVAEHFAESLRGTTGERGGQFNPRYFLSAATGGNYRNRSQNTNPLTRSHLRFVHSIIQGLPEGDRERMHTAFSQEIPRYGRLTGNASTLQREEWLYPEEFYDQNLNPPGDYKEDFPTHIAEISKHARLASELAYKHDTPNYHRMAAIAHRMAQDAIREGWTDSSNAQAQWQGWHTNLEHQHMTAAVEAMLRSDSYNQRDLEGGGYERTNITAKVRADQSLLGNPATTFNFDVTEEGLTNPTPLLQKLSVTGHGLTNKAVNATSSTNGSQKLGRYASIALASAEAAKNHTQQRNWKSGIDQHKRAAAAHYQSALEHEKLYRQANGFFRTITGTQDKGVEHLEAAKLHKEAFRHHYSTVNIIKNKAGVTGNSAASTAAKILSQAAREASGKGLDTQSKKWASNAKYFAALAHASTDSSTAKKLHHQAMQEHMKAARAEKRAGNTAAATAHGRAALAHSRAYRSPTANASLQHYLKEAADYSNNAFQTSKGLIGKGYSSAHEATLRSLLRTRRAIKRPIAGELSKAADYHAKTAKTHDNFAQSNLSKEGQGPDSPGTYQKIAKTHHTISLAHKMAEKALRAAALRTEHTPTTRRTDERHTQNAAGRLSQRSRVLGTIAKREIDAKGHNPVSWVKDESKWKKAKEIVGRRYGGSNSSSHWAVVAHIYEKMGGKVRGHKSTHNSGDIPTYRGTPDTDWVSEDDYDPETPYKVAPDYRNVLISGGQYTQPHNKSRLVGYVARGKGLDRLQNPYQRGTIEHKQWLEGWDDHHFIHNPETYNPTHNSSVEHGLALWLAERAVGKGRSEKALGKSRNAYVKSGLANSPESHATAAQAHKEAETAHGNGPAAMYHKMAADVHRAIAAKSSHFWTHGTGEEYLPEPKGRTPDTVVGHGQGLAQNTGSTILSNPEHTAVWLAARASHAAAMSANPGAVSKSTNAHQLSRRAYQTKDSGDHSRAAAAHEQAAAHHGDIHTPGTSGFYHSRAAITHRQIAAVPTATPVDNWTSRSTRRVTPSLRSEPIENWTLGGIGRAVGTAVAGLGIAASHGVAAPPPSAARQAARKGVVPQAVGPAMAAPAKPMARSADMVHPRVAQNLYQISLADKKAEERATRGPKGAEARSTINSILKSKLADTKEHLSSNERGKAALMSHWISTFHNMTEKEKQNMFRYHHGTWPTHLKNSEKE